MSLATPPFSVGAKVSKSAGTVYQAETDGFVVFSGQSGTNSLGELIARTDSSSPPTTQAQDWAPITANAAGNGAFIVRKGYYYKIDALSTAFLTNYDFYPIG